MIFNAEDKQVYLMSQQLAQQPHITLRDEQLVVPTTLLITNVDLGLHRYFDDKHAPLPQAQLRFQMIATAFQMNDDHMVTLYDNDGQRCHDVYHDDASRFDGRCFNVNYHLGSKELQSLIAAGAYDDTEFMNRLRASFKGQTFVATMPLVLHDDTVINDDNQVNVKYVAFQPTTLELDKYSDSTLPNVVFSHLRQMQDDFVALQTAQASQASAEATTSMAPSFSGINVPTSDLAFNDINVATSEVADVDNDQQQGANVAVHESNAASATTVDTDNSRFPTPSSAAPQHVAHHTVQPNEADLDIPF